MGKYRPFNNSNQAEGLVSEVFEHPNDPNVRLIGTPTSGIWKLNNSTNSWENVTDNLGLPAMGVNEIIVNPFDDNQLFASSGNYAIGSKYGLGILVSNDKGSNWNVMPGYFYDHFTELMKIIIDENDNDPSDGLTMYVISRKEIFKTTNTGASWTQLTNPNSNMGSLEFFDIITNNNGRIFVSTGGQNSTCFSSDDGGISWNDISAQFGVFGALRFSSNVETSTLYCCFDPGGSIRKIAKSTDNGLNWSILPFQTTKGDGANSLVIEHSSLTGFIYLDLGNPGLKRYDDNGVVFNINSGHVDSRDIQFIPSTNGFDKLLRANDGGVEKTVKLTHFSRFIVIHPCRFKLTHVSRFKVTHLAA